MLDEKGGSRCNGELTDQIRCDTHSVKVVAGVTVVPVTLCVDRHLSGAENRHLVLPRRVQVRSNSHDDLYAPFP